MSTTILANLYRGLRSLWADTDGVLLPYVAVLLVVIVGTAALAIDGARYTSAQTQMQKAADALAIAGAAELDRLTTSTGRAYNAVMNTSQWQNQNTFTGTGGGADVTVANIRFLATLPASDSTAITSVLCSNNSCTAAQSVQARFIEVTVTPNTMSTIMPTRFINATMGPLVTSAQAIAGMDGVNCGLTPMFICNPFEQIGDSYDQATARLEAADVPGSSLRRQLIRLADHGPSGTWGPGDFGYLVPEPGTLPTDSCFPNAGDEIGKAMAMDRPLICVRQNGVDLLTGNANAAKDGLNTRFGIYPSGQLSNASCKTAYPPDKNVRKAWQGANWCQPGRNVGSDSGQNPTWPPGTNNASYGVDSCLLGNNSCSPNSNIGAASWDCAAYWAAAHPGVSVPSALSAGCTATATISRKDVYDYETDPANSARLTDPAAGTGETGSPDACTGTTTGTAGRRVLFVAIVNCRSSPVTIQSNAQNVPVAAFGKFFLTHPTTNQTKPYAEFMGLVDRGSGTIRDQVQLYR